MTVKERLLRIRICDQVKRVPGYANKIGIVAKEIMTKDEEEKR